jgi:predicted GIY-YIG superfamily endonuclease
VECSVPSVVILSAAKNQREAISLGLFQEATDVHEAIVREKQFKGWLRAKMLALVESANPRWQDPSNRRFERKKPLRADPSLRSG